VPRYNEFRRLPPNKPISGFDELAADPRDARLIEEVSGGDL
jgi:hypothetical protein